MWGPIHELGHNQQRGCWEFPSHTTECTCNLWSVYVYEEVLRINRAQVGHSFRPTTVFLSLYGDFSFMLFQAHSALTSEKRKARLKKYVANGRNLSDWNTWTALETYLQVRYLPLPLSFSENKYIKKS